VVQIPFDVTLVTASTEPGQVANVIRDKADELKAVAVIMARHPKTKFQVVAAALLVDPGHLVCLFYPTPFFPESVVVF
jgi:hypothetical protein